MTNHPNEDTVYSGLSGTTTLQSTVLQDHLFARSFWKITTYYPFLDSKDAILTSKDDIPQLLRANLLKAQKKMKLQAEKLRMEQIFKVGD